MNAEQVLAAIRYDKVRDELNPGGLFFSELQAPSADRRIDALWIEKFSGRMIGYEIKVSRQDLMHELRQPDKCDPWKRYCDEWWLAVSEPSLIEGLEDQIPSDWGICTPPTASNRRMMTVLRKSTVLAPADKTPVLGKVAGTVSYRMAEAIQRQENAERFRDSDSELIRKLERQLREAGVTKNGADQVEVIKRALNIASERLGYRFSIFSFHGLDIEKAVEDSALQLTDLLVSAHLIHESHEEMLREVQRRAEDIEQTFKDVVAPLRKSWRSGNTLRKIDEILGNSERTGNE